MYQTDVVVKVLGSAQDAGFPHINCDCANCHLARQQPKIKRNASSLAIVLPGKQRWHLIDATPNIPEQIEALKGSFPGLGLMRSVLLSHAHMGHYTGLMFLGREGMATKEMPVFAGTGMATVLAQHVPWKQLVNLRNIQVSPMMSNVNFELDEGVKVLPISVPHRNEYSETFGFIINGPNKRLLYIPDIDRWGGWDQNLMDMVSTVDYCLLDGTFYSTDELTATGRNYGEIPHPLITNTMNLLGEVVRHADIKVYFTHFNHSNPVVNPTRSERYLVEERGFYVVDDGLELTL